MACIFILKVIQETYFFSNGNPDINITIEIKENEAFFYRSINTSS